jgi:hypothetical protein
MVAMPVRNSKRCLPQSAAGPSRSSNDPKDVKITKDMLDLARHIVDQKSGHFAPGKFEDHYEAAVSELLVKKQKGPPLTAAKKPAPDNVVNLMDALRRKYRTESQTGPLFRQAGETSREESGKIEEIRLRKLPGPPASSRIEPEVWALREGLHPHAVKGSGEPLRGPLTAYPAGQAGVHALTF